MYRFIGTGLGCLFFYYQNFTQSYNIDEKIILKLKGYNIMSPYTKLENDTISFVLIPNSELVILFTMVETEDG